MYHFSEESILTKSYSAWLMSWLKNAKTLQRVYSICIWSLTPKVFDMVLAKNYLKITVLDFKLEFSNITLLSALFTIRPYG